MHIRLKWFVMAVTSFILISPLSAQETEKKFETLKGPYLGQDPPGLVPQIFAPGIISTDGSEGCAVFFRKGTVLIFKQSFSAENQRNIFITELENGIWKRPKPAPFDSRYSDGDFTIGTDEKTLYISSRRPVVEGGNPLNESNIWITERIEGKWSEPRLLDSAVNTEYHESYPSVAGDGTLYFFGRRPGGFGKSDIYRSRLKDGAYSETENVGPVINTSEHEWDPYIAPDESFLVFCSTKPGGYGGDDLYVAFHREDGTWTDPVNMGADFNSSASENRPFITPDGQFLFFTSTKSGNRDVYWADAKIINELRPEKLK